MLDGIHALRVRDDSGSNENPYRKAHIGAWTTLCEVD